MAIHENVESTAVHSRGRVVPAHDGIDGSGDSTMMLAHASGFSWDEALLIAAPLLVIGSLIAVARRRIRKGGGS